MARKKKAVIDEEPSNEVISIVKQTKKVNRYITNLEKKDWKKFGYSNEEIKALLKNKKNRKDDLHVPTDPTKIGSGLQIKPSDFKKFVNNDEVINSLLQAKESIERAIEQRVNELGDSYSLNFKNEK